MTNLKSFQFSEKNLEKDKELFLKQLKAKIKLLTNNTMGLRQGDNSFQFVKEEGYIGKTLYLNLVCQLHKDPKTNKQNEFEKVRLSTIKGLPKNKKAPFRYTKCYGCKKESYHGLNNEEKLSEYPERALEYVNSRINSSIVENPYIVKNSNDISTNKDPNTGNYYFYVKLKCRKHPEENLATIKLKTLIGKKGSNKITERCKECNREKKAPADYHLWKDDYFVFRGNKNIELRSKTKYCIADEATGSYPSLKYKWNGRQWVLKVKAYCTEHSILMDDYVDFNSLISNKISSKKCKVCLSRLQSQRARIKPEELRLRLRKSRNKFIKTYYTYFDSSNHKTNQKEYLHYLYCGYHKKYFQQTTREIGKHLGCPDCLEHKIKFTNPQGKDNLSKTEIFVFEKLGANKAHFKVNAAEYKIGAKKQTWVNLTCSSDKHQGVNNFWYGKEAIHPEVCKLCRPDGDSIGETTVLKILLDLNQCPEKKKMLNDCVYIQPQQADFFLTINDQKLIIEFDGEQHFRESKKYGKKKGLLKIINRDKNKNEYAKNRNIHLLRIHYLELKNKDHLIEYIQNAIDQIKSTKAKLITWEFNNKFNQEYQEAYKSQH